MNKYQIIRTEFFEKWLKKLPKEISLRINIRLARVEQGNFGDYKFFGDIGELRFDFSKGYRVYYTIRGQRLIFLLLGGDKKSQDEDFKKARKIIKDLKI